MTLSSSAAQKKVLVIAFILLALDQFTKFWAVLTLENRPRISLIPALIGDGGPWVSLTVTRNTGAAFSFGSNFTFIFSALAIFVIGLIVYLSRNFTNKYWIITLGLMMGGAAGNLSDRVFRAPANFQGGVVDFIAVEKFAVFNVADIAITLAAIGIFLLTLFKVDEKAK
ncbi:MAG: signal peptidase II [Candidatus Nanopelagicales bacterium]